MPDSPTPLNLVRSLAIVVNSLPPYRVHFHRRVAREMPEVKLWTVATHENADQPWAYAPPAEINVVQFGPSESVTRQTTSARGWHEWKKGGRIIDWLKKEQVGAVLLNGYNDAARLRILRWCAKHDVPVLIWGDNNIRCDFATGVKATVKRRVLRKILAWCDAVLACGSLGREFFIKYGMPAERIFLSPLEPDYQQIERVEQSTIDAAAERFALARDHRRIVYSGRLSPEKRPDLAVESFLALAEQRPNWDLLMIGDGVMKQELMARVPERLRARVSFIGFIGEQTVLSALYRLCDVLVLGSDYDHWALVVNEATASGLAVVCTNVVGAAAELVKEGVNGFTFPPNDLAAMTSRLLEVTAEERIEQYKRASPGVLAEWRRRGDPVEGLRQALRQITAQNHVRLPSNGR
jgi:glycosyltransferase involved in cell wall biosynthesis